jgi:hypothetical protein
LRYIRFWIFFAAVVVIAILVAAFRKLRFIDIQVMILVAAVTMASDMLICKQYHLYNYVSIEYRGWYSFWANLIIIPALGLIFIKFAPDGFKRIVVYIATWVLAATLFEHFIIEPYGIIQYHGWRIVPFSLIGYFVVFTAVYVYYRILLKLSC